MNNITVRQRQKVTVHCYLSLVAMQAAGKDPGPGAIILAVAVLSIVLTAPLGAWAIAALGERVLEVAPETVHDAGDAVRESRGGLEFLDDA